MRKITNKLITIKQETEKAMKKNKEDDGIYRKPTKGFSKRTNMIVGIAFVIFVLVCCIIRLFV